MDIEERFEELNPGRIKYLSVRAETFAEEKILSALSRVFKNGGRLEVTEGDNSVGQDELVTTCAFEPVEINPCKER